MVDNSMQLYKVGGSVRDELLGVPPQDHDWLLVGKTSKELLLSKGYLEVGKDFAVYLHPETREEVALPRRHPVLGDEVNDIDADLLGRDMTVNAMAIAPDGSIYDPLDGQMDLANKTLRHCHEMTFKEDPIRILRVARFLARWGDTWRIHSSTEELIRRMVKEGSLEEVTPERVWAEIHKALGEEHPHLFFETLQSLGALKQILPEVARLQGVPQRADYHPEIDTFVHTMMSLKRVCELTSRQDARFSVLVHDIGKGVTPEEVLPRHIGHEKSGADMVEPMCRRLRTPSSYRDLAKIVALNHTRIHNIMTLKPKSLHKLLKDLSSNRNYTVIRLVALCCVADAQGRQGFERRSYPQANYLTELSKWVGKTKLKDLPYRISYSSHDIKDKIYRYELEKIKAFQRVVAGNPNILFVKSPWSLVHGYH